MSKFDKLEWYVYCEDLNGNSIKKFNIFNHYGVMEDLKKLDKKIKDYDEFCKKFNTTLMYYYWSKCEWEVIISDWPPSKRDPKEIKVDVYDQIMLNKDIFFKYVWNTIHPKKQI